MKPSNTLFARHNLRSRRLVFKKTISIKSNVITLNLFFISTSSVLNSHKILTAAETHKRKITQKIDIMKYKI